jgi:hypothetical protein
MEKGKKKLITVTVEIDQNALKEVIADGRLTNFLNTFPTQVAGHIKGQIVEGLATGKFGKIGLDYDDLDFWSFPIPPRPWPFMDISPTSMLSMKVKA